MAREQGHIPTTIRSQTVSLGSQAVSTNKIPTCFIGIMSEDRFDSNHWDNNRDRVRQLFRIPDEFVLEIPIQPDPDDPTVIDHQMLAVQMSITLEKLNSLPKPQPDSYGLRVVRMGVRNSLALNQAIESLVEAWELEPDDKCVQFVALGDTSDRDWLHFTRWLCLSGSIKKVQYYQTMDYNNYGGIDYRQHYLKEAESAKGGSGGGGSDTTSALSLLEMLARNMSGLQSSTSSNGPRITEVVSSDDDDD